MTIADMIMIYATANFRIRTWYPARRDAARYTIIAGTRYESSLKTLFSRNTSSQRNLLFFTKRVTTGNMILHARTAEIKATASSKSIYRISGI
jgi:hypothetical protein